MMIIIIIIIIIIMYLATIKKHCTLKSNLTSIYF